MKIYDVIGVGFGPSNIALAVALQERFENTEHAVEALFLERQPAFAWHPDMLLSGAHMQISFLKDIATLRNPRTAYSFLNYLHEQGRLQDFINLKTFYPSRYEFNDYLNWLADQFAHQCQYSTDVVSVEKLEDTGGSQLLKVLTQCKKTGTQETFVTRSLVIGAGGYSNIPEQFKGFKEDARVFHSSSYLSSIDQLEKCEKVAIIGAGQSAAEIFLDLDAKGKKADLIMRAWAMKPADSSPFVNEIFNPEFTDYVYNKSQDNRDDIMADYKTTNYAAPDGDLIEEIYDIFYTQKVTKNFKHSLKRRQDITDVQATDAGIVISMTEKDTGEQTQETYDAVVLATGYIRNSHEKLLAPVKEYTQNFAVDRNYQVVAKDSKAQPIIFLQGACEQTHGLSDTLLSILAIRSDEICDQIQAQVINKK